MPDELLREVTCLRKDVAKILALLVAFVATDNERELTRVSDAAVVAALTLDDAESAAEIGPTRSS